MYVSPFADNTHCTCIALQIIAADIATGAIERLRSFRSAQTSEYPLHVEPRSQISMKLFNIADATNFYRGGPHYDVPKCKRAERLHMDFLLAHR